MKRLIILPLLCVISLYLVAQTGWFWQNPLPQGNSLHAVSMSGSHWAVGAGGTVIHHVMPGDYWEVVDIGTTENLNDVYVNSIDGHGWIVGDNGTVFFTNDKGQIWIRQRSGVTENLNSVSAHSQACVWACGNKGTVIKSTYDGETEWKNVSPPHRVNFNQINAYHCNEAWLVGDQGVLIYTTNGGQLWTNGFAGTSWDLTGIDMSETSVSYLCGHSGTILSKEWDVTSWTNENESLAFRLYSIVKQLGEPGYAVGDYGTILKGTDGVWEPMESEVPYSLWDVDKISLEDYTYQIVGDHGIMLKNDGWNSEFSIVNDLCWNFVQAIQFVNKDTGWAVTSDYQWDTRKDGTILHTTDGGQTWTIQKEVENSFNDVFFINENEGWAVGRYGMILHTTSGGQYWTTQTSPIKGLITSVYFVDEDNGWIVSRDNWGEVAHTTNGGNTWVAQTNPSRNPMHDVFFIDENKGWAAGLDSSVIRTTNGGETWQWYDVNVSQGFRFASVFFIDDMHGWMAGVLGVIMRTTDGGETWQEVESGVDKSFNDIFFIDPNQGWVVGDQGMILHSMDGGQSWHKQITGVASNLLSAVFFLDENMGWVGGEAGTILKTTNGGFKHPSGTFLENGLGLMIRDNEETTSTINLDVVGTIMKNENVSKLNNSSEEYKITGLELMLDTIIHSRVSDLEIYLSHANVKVLVVYHVTDQGENFIWTQLSDSETGIITDGKAPFYGNFKPYNTLSAFNGMDPNGEWTLTVYDSEPGNQGTLKAWGIRPLYEKTVSNKIDDTYLASHSVQLFQNVPNPFSDRTRIEWVSQISGHTTLEVFNIKGQKTMTLLDQQMSPGTYAVEMDGSELSPGVYFYRLKVGEHSLLRKLILINKEL
ncbi:YCF48-related protein [Saccharicrinis sp. FJH2]|uniref:YCF48-related protein n=1 Tax=Saccharicrinis sp. FJH65 TaxID=3344659 RepID=UPI0035F380F8